MPIKLNEAFTTLQRGDTLKPSLRTQHESWLFRSWRGNAINYHSYFSLLYGAKEHSENKICDFICGSGVERSERKKKLFDANIFYLSFLFWSFGQHFHSRVVNMEIFSFCSHAAITFIYFTTEPSSLSIYLHPSHMEESPWYCWQHVTFKAIWTIFLAAESYLVFGEIDMRLRTAFARKIKRFK